SAAEHTTNIRENTPLYAKDREDMLRLNGALPDFMPGLSSAEKKVRLAKMSYEDFVLNIVKADKQCLWFYQNTGAGNFCVGIDALPALFGWQMGLPGFNGMNLEATPNGVLADLPGRQHGRQNPSGGGGAIPFPDGNAAIARLHV